MYDEKFQEFSSIGKNMNKLFNYFILLQLPSSEEIYFLLFLIMPFAFTVSNVKLSERDPHKN